MSSGGTSLRGCLNKVTRTNIHKLDAAFTKSYRNEGESAMSTMFERMAEEPLFQDVYYEMWARLELRLDARRLFLDKSLGVLERALTSVQPETREMGAEDPKLRVRILGSIRLLGKLFQLFPLSTLPIPDSDRIACVIKGLLSRTDEASIEYLCTFMCNIARYYRKKLSDLADYIDQMRKMADLVSKSRSGQRLSMMLLDTIDFVWTHAAGARQMSILPARPRPGTSCRFTGTDPWFFDPICFSRLQLDYKELHETDYKELHETTHFGPHPSRSLSSLLHSGLRLESAADDSESFQEEEGEAAAPLPQIQVPNPPRESAEGPLARDSGVILLIGAPGVGKSSLGAELARHQANSVFFSVGETMREKGLLDSPDAANMSVDLARAIAKGMLEEALSEFRNSAVYVACGSADEQKKTAESLVLEPPAHGAKHGPDAYQPPMLFLECVKEVYDVHVLMAILEEHGIPLLRVHWIPLDQNKLDQNKLYGKSQTCTVFDVLNREPYFLDKAESLAASRKRDKERNVAARMGKWCSNAVRVLELFSAFGILFEVSVWRDVECVRNVRPGRGKFTTASESVRHKSQPGLLGLGYSAGSSFSPFLPLPYGASGISFTLLQPIVSPRLVTQQQRSSSILSEAAQHAGLLSLSRIPVPTLAVSTASDVEWIAGGGRYLVSRKCDGTHHVLVVDASGDAHFINRAESVYDFPVVSSGPNDLPPLTILDGELMWVDGRGFFIAFDVVCVGPCRAWMWPTPDRIALLEDQLGLCEAEAHEGLRLARSSVQAPGSDPGFHKKQQAPEPGRDSVTVVFKRHLAVSPSNVRALLDTQSSCPYPSDGLIFTPTATTYVLGLQDLLFKWQPAHQLGVDVAGLDFANKRIQMVDDSSMPCGTREVVYECLAANGSKRLTPVSIRTDKKHGNSISSIRKLQENIDKPCTEEALIALFSTAARSDPPASFSPSVVHPARELPFAEVYALAKRAVAEGTVECTLDPATSLEIFNYIGNAPRGVAEHMCRGLVCHAPTESVVATPFVRFADQPSDEEGSACASVKVDGSLIVGFLWEGRPMGCTRRRASSEQAVWATAWMGENLAEGAMEAGWTYLFECVYPDNTVVVSYCFEGIVLLAAVRPDGREASPSERLGIARRMGVMAAPCVVGTSLEELSEGLSRLDNDGAASSEGWVLESAAGRSKLVRPSYKEASASARQLHPLAVWDKVRTNGASRDKMVASTPQRFRREMAAVLDALQGNFSRVAGQLEGAMLDMDLSARRAPGASGVAEATMLEVLGKLEGGLVTNEAALREAVSFLCGGERVQPIASLPCKMYLPDSVKFLKADAHSQWVCSPVRRLLLDSIQPSRDGKVFGYTPSKNFSHVWAKGWAGGPLTGRMSGKASPTLHDVLGDELVLAVLERLDGCDLRDARGVCTAWSRLVGGSDRLLEVLGSVERDVHSDHFSDDSDPAYDGLRTYLYGAYYEDYDEDGGYGSF